jgi:hypothetical protein
MSKRANMMPLLVTRTQLRAGSDPAQCKWTDKRCIALTLKGDPIMQQNGDYLFETCSQPIDNAGFFCVNAGTRAGYRNEKTFVCSKC